MSEIVTSIALLKKVGNTASGNPKYRMLTRHGVYETELDAQVNYTLRERWTERPRPLVRLTFNDAGHVIGAEEITP